MNIIVQPTFIGTGGLDYSFIHTQVNAGIMSISARQYELLSNIFKVFLPFTLK